MQEVKEKVLSRLGKLGQVQFYEPTALQFHGPRPLMGRVERQSLRLYKQRIFEQQKKFKLKLQKIEKYYAKLKAEEQRRLDLLASFEEKGLLIPAPVFQPIDVVVPKPVIGIPGMPILRRTRLHSRARAKGLRRLR